MQRKCNCSERPTGEQGPVWLWNGPKDPKELGWRRGKGGNSVRMGRAAAGEEGQLVLRLLGGSLLVPTPLLNSERPEDI